MYDISLEKHERIYCKVLEEIAEATLLNELTLQMNVVGF